MGQCELQPSSDSILQSRNSRQDAFLTFPGRTRKSREVCALRRERQKTHMSRDLVPSQGLEQEGMLWLLKLWFGWIVGNESKQRWTMIREAIRRLSPWSVGKETMAIWIHADWWLKACWILECSNSWLHCVKCCLYFYLPGEDVGLEKFSSHTEL